MSGRSKKYMWLFIVVTGVIILAAVGYAFVLYSYPLNYEDILVEQSEHYGLDPYFVAAIIRNESRFNRNAESELGATGLMQIMPETGEWIADHLDMDDYSETKLTDAEVNITMGTWYLDYLMDLFGQNHETVAAAYFAGQGQVLGWLEDPAYSSDGSTLDYIPFEGTREYVERMNSSYDFYKTFYNIG